MSQHYTYPDLGYYLLSCVSHMHCPSPGILMPLEFWTLYLSTLDLRLVFSTRATGSLYCTYTSSLEHLLMAFYYADLGPQDASHPSSPNTHPVSTHESEPICHDIFFLWWLIHSMEKP
jgi:hypothetical protein